MTLIENILSFLIIIEFIFILILFIKINQIKKMYEIKKNYKNIHELNYMYESLNELYDKFLKISQKKITQLKKRENELKILLEISDEKILYLNSIANETENKLKKLSQILEYKKEHPPHFQKNKKIDIIVR